VLVRARTNARNSPNTQKQMKAIARIAPLSERERFANMGIRQLHGMIGRNREHLRDNVRNGVYKTRPETLDGLLHALQTRQAELEAFRIEWAQRPRAAFEATAAKRRAEAEEYEDAVVELQATGKGGVLRYVVPKAKVAGATQRADS
jgi:hypothetical protein